MVLHYYDKKIHGGVLNFRQVSLFKESSKTFTRRFLVEGGLVSIYSGLLILFFN